jgi:RNA polymerase sigma-70 factor, ECF subfamily
VPKHLAKQVRDEVEAIALAQAGDEAGWTWLIETWQGPLVAFLARMSGNEDDALEIAQEAFIRALRHIGNFKTGKKFSTWIFGIAVNLLRDVKKSARNRLVQTLPDMVDVSDRRSSAAIDSDQERRDLTEDLNATIMRLPQKLLGPFLLFYEEDLSLKEISEALGIPASLAKVQLYRARKFIAKANPQLKEYL